MIANYDEDSITIIATIIDSILIIF